MGRGSWFVGRGSWFVGRGSWVVGRGSWDKRRLSNACTNKSQPRPRPQPHSNHDANHGPVVYLVSREALARDEHPRVHDLYLTHVARGVVGHVEVDHEVALGFSTKRSLIRMITMRLSSRNCRAT